MDNSISVSRIDPLETEFVKDAKNLIKKAVKDGDFSAGFSVINTLYEQGETLAEVIGTGFDIMERAWDKFDHEGDDTFFNAAVRNTKLNPVTIRNRINVSQLLRSGRIPKIYKDQIKELGQKSMIRVANTAKSKYTITKDDWAKFASSVSEQEVDTIARAIENKKPRSNFVGLYYKKNGELLAFVDGELVTFGQLSMDKDPRVKKAREILIARAKILDRVEY